MRKGASAKSLVSMGPQMWLLGACALGAVVLFAASFRKPVSLDEIYGDMARGCNYDGKANDRIIMVYVDETSARPRLVRPDGGKRLASFFGKASLNIGGEFYTLTIPISGATLYGIPVSQLSLYRGFGNGIAGVKITFPVPMGRVKEGLARAGVDLVPLAHEFGEYVPELQSAQDGSQTELICDVSM
jgi:hypothetical protein